MAVFVCYSAEHRFTEKTFLLKFADREEEGEEKRDGVGDLGVTVRFGHCGSVTLTFGHG